MNMAFLTGRLGADPEIRVLNSGDRVANFSLATEERWKDRQSGEKRTRTTWHRVVVFLPGTVKFLDEHVHKGDLIQVLGILRNEEWTDGQGQKRQTTKVAVTGPAHRVERLAGVRERTSGEGETNNRAFDADLDDEIPF